MICKKGNTFMKDKIKEEFECTDKEAVEIKKNLMNYSSTTNTNLYE